MGSLTDPAGIESFVDIAVAGDYAYLACRDHFRVVDISDPVQPHYPEGGNQGYLAETADLVAVIGNVAYVLDSLSLKSIDISAAASPAIGTTIPLSETSGILVSSDSIYLWSDTRMTILDISAPLSPIILATHDLVQIVDLKIADRLLLVISDSIHVDEFRLFDLTDPLSPAGTASFNNRFKPSTVLALSKTQAFIGVQYGMEILNISDPYHPQHAREIYLDIDSISSARNLTGNYLYLFGHRGWDEDAQYFLTILFAGRLP